PPEGASNALSTAEAQYVRRQYAELTQTLAELVEPEHCFEDKDALLEAFLLLGVAAHELERPEQAEHYFLSLLRLDPEYQQEALIQVPQSASLFFEQVRLEHDAELREIMASRVGSGVLLETVYVTVEQQQNQFWICFLPFGAGQFQNDQDDWGYTLLGLQTAALGINVLGAVMVELIRGSTHTFTRDERARAEAWQLTQLSAGAVFLVFYAVGVIHAAVEFEEVRTTLLPPTREDPSNSAVELLPMIGMDSLGLGLSLRF
ncbi:MAG: hypothetical protein RBU37_18245, partial [Myxococcota bacterium]|nr:hypothetical protein [Myxococcota bacterium]